MTNDASNTDLERFRPYLNVLARLHMGPALLRRQDPADFVQHTFLEAHRNLPRFRGTSEAELRGWLRQILVMAIAQAVRALTSDKRDPAREQELRLEFDRSQARVEQMFVAMQTSPSMKVHRNEQAQRLAEAMAQLPELQQEILLKRYCEGMALNDIAAQLDKTPDSVAGLIKRASARLRALLAEASM